MSPLGPQGGVQWEAGTGNNHPPSHRQGELQNYISSAIKPGFLLHFQSYLSALCIQGVFLCDLASKASVFPEVAFTEPIGSS